jgi:acyl carrier protein
MVPSHYVVLDSLPLTPNGKIDRNSLPAAVNQNRSARSAQSPGEDPRSEVERTIAKVWAEALGADDVGVDQNIFDLGATSLMIPEVLLELQRKLDCEISLVDLFEFHTVNTLAAHLAGTSAPTRRTNRAQRRLAARHPGGGP